MTTFTHETALVTKKPYPSLVSILASVVIFSLVILFITGWTVKFYASFLFLFYSLIGSMWVSVVALGVFQTILLLPIRVVNLIKGSNTDDFIRTIAETNQESEQQILIKKHAYKGTPALMWYTVSFFIQTVSYISMGRLFLIDFYSKPLNPDLLFSFVPYPDYPIQGTIFKIPYVGFTDTTDLGFKAVLISWFILFGMRVVVSIVKYFKKQFTKPVSNNDPKLTTNAFLDQVVSIWNGSFVLLLIGSYVLMRNFPTGLELRIFSGSITVPNVALNTITAVATFFTIFWLDQSKIRKKAVLARDQGIDEAIIEETQRERFKDSLRNGALLGLGAFFITNQIPSAFELSIFTLEIISWLAPFTIDRIILRARNPVLPENAVTLPIADTPAT